MMKTCEQVVAEAVATLPDVFTLTEIHDKVRNYGRGQTRVQTGRILRRENLAHKLEDKHVPGSWEWSEKEPVYQKVSA